MVDNTEQDDGIIELTQVVDENSSDALDQDVIELIDIHTQTKESKKNDLDLDFDAGTPISAVESTITQEQLDAALERVIEKKFETKIETILIEVMEKVLEKEIVNIRKRLQQDLDEINKS